MNFIIPPGYLEIESCLYKLYYGDRYVIVKGKTLAGSVYLIEKGYAGFLAGGKLAERGFGLKAWKSKNAYYFKLYSYMKKFPSLQFRVEVLLESNNGYQLLKHEYIELQKCIRDKKCLNSNVTSYIPQFREETKSYGWISKAHVLNFKKFLKQPSPTGAGSN